MKRSTVLAGVTAGVGVGVATARRVRSKLPSAVAPPSRDQDRHLAVTVLRSPDEVAPDGRPPERLAELGDLVDVHVRPAPADRGTELHVHLRRDPGGNDDGDEVRRRVRAALRETKQLLETGEVLRPDRPTTTHPTLTNAPLRAATAAARGEGVS
jgi:hypothetical protein